MTQVFKQPTNKFLKFFLAFLGLISLLLGILGIFVPLLPTTPFLLLSATLFMKSSKKLYNWLINQKYLGKYIENYLHHKTISTNTKISALSFLWITITASVLFIVEKLIIKILLLAIAIGVTIHILSFKSKIEK